MTNTETQPVSEDELVSRAQQALSRCNWVIGECAADWTERYAKGRTDGDFGALIGLSGDQVYQRRRVWETFADVYQNYGQLKWSHFYVALNWDDAAECLQWAEEMEATVAEMKAWRRAQNGEDLSQPAEEPPFSIAPEYINIGTAMVRDPDEFGDGEGRGTVALVAPDGSRSETAQSAAREAGEYAPFGAGARGETPKDNTPRNDPTSQQILERATKMLEKVVDALTPAIIEDFADAPLALQQRFLNAVENLESRTANFR